MFFSSVEEINRLISKGMPNIYLEVIIEKKWRSQNFDFLSLLKRLFPGQFLRRSSLRRYHGIFKLFVAS